ncbi:hypothetical protein LIER_04758 [Lithospermum erythrorhizon]|uniref:Integrase catalytic domain-containing protein n=1 Tax=Lithospermum erythrorhizon TaxID=34254 RepID=A0AAV3NXW7_LITER
MSNFFIIKAAQAYFPLSTTKTSSPFELVHADIWGPYRKPTYTGSRYFLTIMDDYTRVVWTFKLRDKTVVPQIIKEFLKMIPTQFSRLVKVFRSDNGSEFLNKYCTELFALTLHIQMEWVKESIGNYCKLQGLCCFNQECQGSFGEKPCLLQHT